MGQRNHIDSKILRRRRFLFDASILGAGSLFGFPQLAAAEAAPEITTIRLIEDPAICLAPQYLAEELLKLEGFREILYVKTRTGGIHPLLDDGEADLSMDPAPRLVYGLDGRPNLVALAGIHAGCYELFAHDKVRSLHDLKGNTISIYAFNGADHILISSVLAYVGIDPRRDVKWLPDDKVGDAMRRFGAGEADAFMGFAPQPQELRLQKIGHVILNTAQDRPWSQYFCCMVVANRNFVSNYPAATKRALRAFLKAADICAREPERVGRFLADRGFESRYSLSVEVLKSLPYRRWREVTRKTHCVFMRYGSAK